jgi:hypothetical protein
MSASIEVRITTDENVSAGQLLRWVQFALGQVGTIDADLSECLECSDSNSVEFLGPSALRRQVEAEHAAMREAERRWIESRFGQPLVLEG